MRTIKILFALLLLVNLSLISAQTNSITFTLAQKDYYFKIGTPATLTLKTENTYGENISGQLSSTINQSINQLGASQYSTSSNSIPMTIQNGKNQLGINFGTSRNPITLDIALSFQYFEQENKAVNLKNIKIHFVQNDSQNQQQQNQQQQASSQNQQSQQQQQIEQQINKMKQQQQQTSQKLTNSQSSQDSSVLKKQIEQQNREQQAQKETMKKSLEQNKQIQQENQKMLNKGYKMKNMEINPRENNSGDFKMNYEKANGDNAQIKGEIENNTLKNLQTTTAEDKKEALNKLKQNKDFQKISKQLQKENFSSISTQIEKNENETDIRMKYTNEKNQTATITAKIKNQAVKDVKLEKENSSHLWTWITAILTLITTLFVTNKLYKKYKLKPEMVQPQAKPEKPYNYKKAAKQLLIKSKKLFEQKEYKDAYEKSSQAIRLFLNHKHNLKKETTNDEILQHLKEKNENNSKLKNILDLCSLVEFAKYKPNKKDFDNITNFAERLIK